MEPEMALVVATLGIAIGIVGRTCFPYIKRWLESEKKIAFDKKYLLTAMISFFVALGTASELVAEFDLAANVPWWMLFLLAILYGATWNSGINRFTW